MADYTRKVKKILKAHGCTFVRYSPIINANFSIDGKIESRISANKQLKDAGIKQKV